MPSKRPIILAIVLLISIFNYNRLQENRTIRLIQFLSIFIMGFLCARNASTRWPQGRYSSGGFKFSGCVAPYSDKTGTIAA